MDPFDDAENGFSFGANAAGAQWEVIMSQWGQRDLSWDKWTPKSPNYEDKWIFEAAIHSNRFATKRDFRMGLTFLAPLTWRLPLKIRLGLRSHVNSPPASLAYTGITSLGIHLHPAGQCLRILMFLEAVARDFVSQMMGITVSLRRGGYGAKIPALTSLLKVLDLTLYLSDWVSQWPIGSLRLFLFRSRKTILSWKWRPLR